MGRRSKNTDECSTDPGVQSAPNAISDQSRHYDPSPRLSGGMAHDRVRQNSDRGAGVHTRVCRKRRRPHQGPSARATRKQFNRRAQDAGSLTSCPGRRQFIFVAPRTPAVYLRRATDAGSLSSRHRRVLLTS
eukprot:8274427-Alexandrium_andersonii.AAC.1